MKANSADVVAAVLLGVLSLWALTAITGRVTRSDGAGYDGEVYVKMVQNGWHRDGGGPQLRPFFMFVAEFVNNYYAGVLAAALVLLIRAAGADALRLCWSSATWH